MKLKVWMGIAVLSSLLIAAAGAVLVAADDHPLPMSSTNQVAADDPPLPMAPKAG
ncbi:hypothetical protein [Tumebacillus flagellatus]|uniref:hypothetical protein n=1 Tax=Tumebacillus flagellatus TaxID=1157490 RepID=UPI001378ED27|nr:hypothetical protein [Tumebacillus flagellatus]